MSDSPANPIQDLLVFGEFGDVNPSITDSTTYTFLTPEKMEAAFSTEMEGCFLYSRHWNPTNRYLSRALAGMEGTEAAQVTASGMSAIACTILQLCRAGDEVVAARTIYGGTYALFRNFLPRLGIEVRFVDVHDAAALAAAVTPRTRVLYTESMSNPLLEVADLGALAAFAHARGLTLVVDNTFTPMILSPARLGADVVIHSLTKFINGTSDAIAGAVCASKAFIAQLTDVNGGACMLMGPVLDSLRAAGILKNLHSLHIRMRQHSHNAMALARHLAATRAQGALPGAARPSAARAAGPRGRHRHRLWRHAHARRRGRRHGAAAHDGHAGGAGRLPGGEPRLLQDAVQRARALDLVRDPGGGAARDGPSARAHPLLRRARRRHHAHPRPRRPEPRPLRLVAGYRQRAVASTRTIMHSPKIGP